MSNLALIPPQAAELPHADAARIFIRAGFPSSWLRQLALDRPARAGLFNGVADTMDALLAPATAA